MLIKEQMNELTLHRIVFNKKKFKKEKFQIKYLSKYGSMILMTVELGYFTLNRRILNKPMNKAFYDQHN